MDFIGSATQKTWAGFAKETCTATELDADEFNAL